MTRSTELRNNFWTNTRSDFLNPLVFFLLPFFLLPLMGQPPLRFKLPLSINEFQPITALVPISDSNGKLLKLYLDRKNFKQNTGGVQDPDDIWFAEMDSSGELGQAQNSDSFFNTSLSDVMYCRGLVYHYGKGFSYPSRHGNSLNPTTIDRSEFKNLKGSIYASLSQQLDVLVLAIERSAMGYNGNDLDLFVSFIDGSNATHPVPIQMLNTSSTEASPYISNDGRSIIFASSGLGGRGNLDLFISHRLDGTWLKWTPPVPLVDVNSPENESWFCANEAETHAAIISWDVLEKRSAGFYCPITIPTNKTLGTTTIRIAARPSDIPLTVRVKSESSERVATFFLDDSVRRNGNSNEPLHFQVDCNEEYRLEFDTLRFELTEVSTVNRCGDTLSVFLAPKTKAEMSNSALADFTGEVVFFESLSAELSLESIGVLKRVQPRDAVLHVIGWTDERGSKHANESLARERAKSVAAFLYSIGWKKTMVQVVSRGEDTSLSNPKEFHRARRVDIRLADPAK